MIINIVDSPLITYQISWADISLELKRLILKVLIEVEVIQILF